MHAVGQFMTVSAFAARVSRDSLPMMACCHVGVKPWTIRWMQPRGLRVRSFLKHNSSKTPMQQLIPAIMRQRRRHCSSAQKSRSSLLLVGQHVDLWVDNFTRCADPPSI